MLINQTLEGLSALSLPSMVRGLKEQLENPSYQELSFEERLGMLVDKELLDRETRRINRNLKAARLRINACVEDVDFMVKRGLDRYTFMGLSQALWVRSAQNVVITGPTGVGKTYLACALADSAIKNGKSALYFRLPRLIDELQIARVDGRWPKVIQQLLKTDLLVVDDFLLRPMTSDQAAEILEVIDDRTKRRSTLFASQLPVDMWHPAIKDTTIADALLDRILDATHRIELKGDTMRKTGVDNPAQTDAG